MTVSNALPIQFWPVDEDTYNETQVCGVEPRCWCAPWQCDDAINLQISTSGEEDPEEFSYAVLNSEGVFVFNESFDSSGSASFTPDDEDICDGEYQVIIYDNTGGDVKAMKEPSEWVDEIGTWTKNDGSNFFENGPTGNIQQNIRMPLDLSDGTIFTFTFSVTLTGTWTGNVVMAFLISDSSGLNKDTPMENLVYTANVSGESHSVTFTVRNGGGFSTDPMAFLKFIWFGPTASGTATVRITIEPGVVFEVGDSVIYKSDCIDIRTEQECTELITYSNNKDFAGLRYTGISPLPEFNLRVPAVFFHESFPQEQEVHPLSDDTWIRLSDRMERKKNLDLGYMPYYMHQKIQLILMHDNIEIGGEQWKKRDPYNIEEGNKRYPKPKANVLLTDKNFIIRNLI